MQKLGIPYMGSKRKLAGEILHFISQRHNRMTDFYDLFGGGGAVSFGAIRDYRFNVHYNELNKHIYCLVKYLKDNRILEPKLYEWVTREDFHKQCARADADYYSGFVMSCWSFGNNSDKGYLYGKDIQETKKLAHNFIVNNCIESMNQLGINIPELSLIKDVHKRRMIFCDYFKKSNLGRLDVQNLEVLRQLENIQALKRIQALSLNNESYEDVIINGELPVIYCDIPYKGTEQYREAGFNYEAFYEWATICKNPVYISEYSAPFQEVKAFKDSSSLSASSNKKEAIEKIFWNGKGVTNQTSLF